MVHQTAATNRSSAPSASSKMMVMNVFFRFLATALILGMLASCATKPEPEPAPEATTPAESTLPPFIDIPDTEPIGPAMQRPGSRWVPVRWVELVGFDDDDFHDAWNAWLRTCGRPKAPFESLCTEVRRLTLASSQEQRQWMRQRLQPYRVETKAGQTDGLLTSYFEPMYDASRTRRPGFEVPVYAPPPALGKGRWYSRREMDMLPAAQSALAGHEIAWLADPIDLMILQIQGSGRLRVQEPDGSDRVVRLAYAATNNQPYRSPGSWLMQQGAIDDATWPGIKRWLAANPNRVQDFMWSNPRVVFFREEPLGADAQDGPRGAHGVPLTAGRSIAIDPSSIPYGAPVWLVTRGPVANIERLVLAQDTGSAIKGSVRADLFAGTGVEAGDFAGRMKQPLRLWVLWPKK